MPSNDENTRPEERKPKTISLELSPSAEKSDRRKKMDFISRTYRIMAFFSWVLFTAGLFFIGSASRSGANFITRALGMTVVSGEDSSLLHIAFFVYLSNVVLCLLGLLLNSMRMKRKGDSYSKSLIVFFVLSVLVGAAILFNW